MSTTSPDHPVTAYARAVISGLIVAGPWVRLAAKRHLDDLADGGKRGLRFNERRATHAINFFPKFLRLREGQFEGLPFELQPWQQFIIGSLFGWQGPDGYRRFQQAYVESGKGSGKTPMMAGVLLYGLMFDDENGAQIVCAARAREQARLMFDDCRKMALASVLSNRLDINKNNILDLSTASWIRPVSAEAQTLEGKRIHMAGVDEIWTHPDDKVILSLLKGTKARRQPLFLEITNSGFDRSSICWQHHEKSLRVVRGVLEEDAWFAYVCGLDEGDDPFVDESCWVKANPNLGVSLPLKYLRGEVERARGLPSEVGELLRKNFCVWTQQQTRFIPIDKWITCGASPLADEDLSGWPCWGGLDLGQRDDLTAFAVVWRRPDESVVVRAWFWLPRAAVTAHPDRPYEQWEREGWLTITEGDVLDYPVVSAQIAAVCRALRVREIGYDGHYANDMAQRLDSDGIEMVETPQGFKLNEPLMALLGLVTSGALRHDRNPIMTYMADNLEVARNVDGLVRPVKPKGSGEAKKIDGMVALAMAIDRMIRTPQPGSIYDERFRRGERVLTVV